MSFDANVVIDQLGGRRIFAMAFTTAVCDSGNANVTFHVAKSLTKGGRATHVTVRLCEDDTYIVSTYRYPMRTDCIPKVLKEESGVYGDMLKRTVEAMTGLYLSL